MSGPRTERTSVAGTYQRRAAALAYARRGLPVLPCKPRGKEPLTPHGVKDATADIETVEAFWHKWPNANVAIATGSVSGIFVVDVDTRNGGATQLAELEARYGALPPGHVVETSAGGRHYYFRSPPGVVVRCGQLAPGIDIKCEGGYVLAPPSVHPSGHVYRLVQNGAVSQAPEWLIAQLVQQDGAQAHAQQGQVIDLADLHVSERIKQLIRDGKSKGQRSEAVFGVIRAMDKVGHTYDEIFAVLMNEDYGISEKPRERGPSWLQGEIKRARQKLDVDADSAEQRNNSASSDCNASGKPPGGHADGSSSCAAPSSTATARFKLLSADELKQMPPPRWLVPDLLVAESFAVLYGPPGIGKSFLALDLALSIATGCEGVTEAEITGPVVYVAAEGLGGLSKRVEAWEKAQGCKAENIYFLPEAVNLIDSTETKALISAIGHLAAPPMLIVLDTMARCLNGADENSSKDVGIFVSMADALRRTFRCAVLVVHHGTKSNAQTERGSSALRGAADTMLFLIPQLGRPELTLSCEKQKDAPPFEPLPLRLEQIELREGESSCVMRPGGNDPAGSDASSSVDEKTVLDLLSQGGERTYTELKNQFIADTKRGKSTFNRVMATLRRRGSIRKIDGKKYALVGSKSQTGSTQVP